MVKVLVQYLSRKNGEGSPRWNDRVYDRKAGPHRKSNPAIEKEVGLSSILFPRCWCKPSRGISLLKVSRPFCEQLPTNKEVHQLCSYVAAEIGECLPEEEPACTALAKQHGPRQSPAGGTGKLPWKPLYLDSPGKARHKSELTWWYCWYWQASLHKKELWLFCATGLVEKTKKRWELHSFSNIKRLRSAPSFS